MATEEKVILNERVEQRLKSNIEIVFHDLEKAITDYLDYGHTCGEFRYIDAYLSATTNAIVSYIECLQIANRIKETEIIEALKFTNNLQKHNERLVTLERSIGGFTFPFCFPEEGLSIEKIAVIWDDCIGLNTRKPSQKENYTKHFMQRNVLETLKPIVQELLSDKEFKEL